MLNYDIIGYIRSQIQAATFGTFRQGKINLKPPGGFDGQLIQSAVAYDTSELATSGGSTSLWDNLNHIRQLIATTGTLTNILFYQDYPAAGTLVGGGSQIGVNTNFRWDVVGRRGNLSFADRIYNPTISAGSLNARQWFDFGSFGGRMWGDGGYWGDGEIYGLDNAIAGKIRGGFYLGHDSANDILNTVASAGSPTHALYWGNIDISSPAASLVATLPVTLSGGSVGFDVATTLLTRYLLLTGGTLTGVLTVPNLTITGNGVASGKLWTAVGGSGAGSWVESPISLPVTTTKGDLLVSDGSHFQIFPVGVDSKILAADSTQSLGVKWVAPSGGSTNSIPIIEMRVFL